MRRRGFITLLGAGAVTSPLTVRTQQPAMPVIGYLSGGSAVDERPREISGLIRGLAETGYIEGQNVTIEYRFQLDDAKAMLAEASEEMKKVELLDARHRMREREEPLSITNAVPAR